MATEIRAHHRGISSTIYDSFSRASTGAYSVSKNSTTLIARDADTKEWVSQDLASEYHPKWIGWRSEAVSAQATISGDVTFAIRSSASITGAGRVHAKLFKRTAGGSDVETLIAEGDAAADITTSSVVYTFAVTPPAAVTVAYGERLLLRLYVKRRSADFDTSTFTLGYDHSANTSKVTLTETVTFLLDIVTLIPRRTSVAAIGNFFDLLPTRGVSASTTGVVNTTASGTEIQWTRTAGGTLLEWISPRFKGPWLMVDPLQYGSAARHITAHESNLAANCSTRLKLFRRRPDGTETLMLTNSDTSELTTTATRTVLPTPATLNNVTTFAEDDRLVARAYIINIGTMGGSRTCTIGYDHSATTVGDTSFGISDMAEFKAEGDPGASSPPSGLSTVGVGN